MSYRVETASAVVPMQYKIIEKGSEYEVYSTLSKDEARRMCRALNLGAGFNGNTPEFFTKRYVL